MIKRPVVENGLVADLFHDGSGQPRQAIVMLGGSEGGKIWSSIGTRKPVNQLVSLGYTLLSLAYFKSPELPATVEAIPLEYFERAFEWLAGQKEVLSNELIIIGVSKGGEAALLLGSLNPKIKAVVALSPSHVVWQGIPKMGGEISNARKSTWTYKGDALPFVPYQFTSWNLGTSIRTVLFGELLKEHEKALQNEASVTAAIIPVEKIQGPILLMSGKRDQMWPSTAMCEQIIRRLEACGFGYPYQHVAYDASHTGYILKKECWRVITTFLQG